MTTITYHSRSMPRRDSLYLLQRLGGRLALYRTKLTQPVSTELVASNPYVDIDNVERSSNGQRVIGYTLAEDQRETIYFDPEYKALRASLSRALPKLPLIHFAGASQDGNKILLVASADNDPGRYFVFDRKAKNLAEVMLVRPELEKRALASVRPVRVEGSDGTPIPGYLTLPVGSTGKNLPAVVAAPWRAECPRRMGVRLARPIPRCAWLCGASAQLSRFRRLRRRMAGRERLQELEDVNRRHHRFGQMVG